MEEDSMSDAWRSRTLVMCLAGALLLLGPLLGPFYQAEHADNRSTASSGPLLGRLSPAPGEGGSEFIAICSDEQDMATGGNVEGWTIAVGEGKGDDDWLAIPHSNGTLLYAATYGCIYIAEMAEPFNGDMGFLPALEAEDTRPDVPQVTLPVGGHWPRLVNNGAVVTLLDENGTERDRVAYGVNSTGSGWLGPPAAAPRPGEILTREALGADGRLSFPDTNTSAEWEHLRRYYPRQSLFPASWQGALGATFIPLPDASTSAAGLMDGAGSSIDVNVYKFTSWPMAERLIGALGRGVAVRVLVEGAPVGGMDPSEAFILEELERGGADVRVMKGDTSQGIHRRYSMDHAKYMIVDGSTLLIGSENWVSTGLSGSTTYGNRGWAMAIDMIQGECGICGLFEQDISLDEPDVLPWDIAKMGVKIPTDFPGQKDVRDGPHVPVFGPYETQGDGGVSYELVVSPDTSLPGLEGMLDSAKERVLIEIFSVDLYWEDRSGHEIVSPLVDKVVEAARRGVPVKVLLDRGFAPTVNGTGDDGTGDGNGAVKSYLEGKARSEGLDLSVRWVDIDGIELLHNKAMVVDDLVLVSSINWVGASVLSNRELGVIVRDRPMSDKAAELFISDWDGEARGGGGGGWGDGNDTAGQEKGKRVPFVDFTIIIPMMVIATVIWDVRHRCRYRS